MYQYGNHLYNSVFNPIDPNPAISAHAVFRQFGHIRPEKRQIFPYFSTFFQWEPTRRYLIYNILCQIYRNALLHATYFIKLY